MSRTEKQLFELALVESIMIKLTQGNEATVPGLGSFIAVHRPAVILRPDDSTASSAQVSLSIEPPVITVHFHPDVANGK